MLGLNRRDPCLDHAVGSRIGQCGENTGIRNECFMFLARDDCESRLSIRSGCDVVSPEYDTYKGEKMVEVAVRLGEEDLGESLAW